MCVYINILHWCFRGPIRAHPAQRGKARLAEIGSHFCFSSQHGACKDKRTAGFTVDPTPTFPTTNLVDSRLGCKP